MVAALPANIRLKLAQTLGQWRHWDCDPPLRAAPEVIAKLGAGHSNFSVLVEAGQRFVVRIDGINPAAHSLNRQGEWRSLVAAHAAGIAPRPRYSNPELGCLVCDYLAPDTAQPLVAGDLAALLRDIHNLPARHQRLDLAERILAYEKRLEHRGADQHLDLLRYSPTVTRLLNGVKNSPQPLVLCHNDLLRANRIYSGAALYALDWEYAAMGSPWYDLAIVIAGDSLDEATAGQLLTGYLQRAATGEERLLIQHYSSIYRYLELLWYRTQDQPALPEEQLQLKLAQLDASIAGVPA